MGTTTTDDPVLTPDEFVAERDRLVAEKFDDVDLWDHEKDALDRGRLHDEMWSIIKLAVVTSKTERATGALTKGTLVHSVVTDVPEVGSDEFAASSELDQAVAKEVTGRVWREVKPYTASGLAGRAHAQGLILIKAEVVKDKDPAPAVYLTEVMELILQDFKGPLRDRVRNATKQLATNMSRVQKVLPQHAEAVTASVAKDMKSASTLSKSLLELEAGDE